MGSNLRKLQKKYRGQLDNIIKGLFPHNPEAGDPKNWNMDFNSIMGGQGYQHPHSDHARSGTYKSLKLFPFVGLHGFNLEPFSLWLLPPNSDYGFMHTFEPHQILFMRGDQVHAGVPSPTPRGHMEFFPLLAGCRVWAAEPLLVPSWVQAVNICISKPLHFSLRIPWRVAPKHKRWTISAISSGSNSFVCCNYP